MQTKMIQWECIVERRIDDDTPFRFDFQGGGEQSEQLAAVLSQTVGKKIRVTIEVLGDIEPAK